MKSPQFQEQTEQKQLRRLLHPLRKVLVLFMTVANVFYVVAMNRKLFAALLAHIVSGFLRPLHLLLHHIIYIVSDYHFSSGIPFIGMYERG